MVAAVVAAASISACSGRDDGGDAQGEMDSDDEPLVKKARVQTTPRQVQRCFVEAGAQLRRGDDKRTREGTARRAAVRAATSFDDGRTVALAGVGRATAARLQRDKGPQLFMPDDVGQAGGDEC